MAQAVTVDEIIACPHIGSGEATERLLELAGIEYQTVAASADRLHFARAIRPTWALVTGILLLPVLVGIPLLLVRTTETWVAAIEVDHRRVQVRITGRVIPDLMTSLLAALSDGPRLAPQPPPTSIYDVVPPGPAGMGSNGIIGPTAFSTPVPESTPEHLPSSETTIPELASTGLTKRHVGFAPVTRPTVPSDDPVDGRTVLRSSVPSTPPASFADVQLPGEARLPVRALAPTVAAMPVPGVGRAPESTPLLAAFDTGERVPMEDGATLFIGRDPAAIGDVSRARLVTIDDPSRSISKTHLSVNCTGGLVGVSDLGSTNGTMVATNQNSASTVLEPHEVTVVAPGTRIQFGERSFVLEPADAGDGSR